MRAEMQASRDALREYQAGEKFDEAEFRALARKQADLKADMMVKRIKAQQEMQSVLTAEQKAKAEKLWGADYGFMGPQHGQKGCAQQGQRCGKMGQGPGAGKMMGQGQGCGQGPGCAGRSLDN